MSPTVYDQFLKYTVPVPFLQYTGTYCTNRNCLTAFISFSVCPVLEPYPAEDGPDPLQCQPQCSGRSAGGSGSCRSWRRPGQRDGKSYIGALGEKKLDTGFPGKKDTGYRCLISVPKFTCTVHVQ
jgi:hypothetical protein